MQITHHLISLLLHPYNVVEAHNVAKHSINIVHGWVDLEGMKFMVQRGKGGGEGRRKVEQITHLNSPLTFVAQANAMLQNNPSTERIL